jgi:hypothetical protein
MAYTYLVKCLPTNEYYYGVRYAKNSRPDDLWVKYFTSSKVVKQRIDLFGKQQFAVEVRKVFSTAKDAMVWEDRVLRRLKVVDRINWLNRHYGCVFERRVGSVTLGLKMVRIVATGKYMYETPAFAQALVEQGRAVIEGTPKPQRMREAMSKHLTGRPKTGEHLRKMLEHAANRKGVKLGSEVDRYGAEKAAELASARSAAKRQHYIEHGHHATGKTYEEIYGAEKAESVKEMRSRQFLTNNPSASIKGKTYEDIYGAEKAAELRSTRGQAVKKTYVVSQHGQILFDGDRVGANDVVNKLLQCKSGGMYQYARLTRHDITVTCTLCTPR